MTSLREWQITADSPYELHLSSDARLSKTSYINDQSWDVVPGSGDQPAIKLQTQYGHRAGLVSIVPMWDYDGRSIYQAHTYHNPATITAFAPNRIIVEADILPNLHLIADHIALTSQVIGGIYTLHNQTKQASTVRLDLFGHAIVNDEEQKLAIISMTEGDQHALSLGKYTRLEPLVLIEGGNAPTLSGRNARPKVGKTVTIEAGTSQTIRFVHVGLEHMRQSLAEARRWLLADWQPFLTSVEHASQTIPAIQTGNLDWDLVIASGYNRVMQSVLRANGIFPRETFVVGRLPEYGFSRSGNGTDHPRMWQGQWIDSAYLIAPVLAHISPPSAEGIIRNYVAMQKADGFIDLVPNMAGEHANLLCTPILARTAWAVYSITENKAFLQENFAGLKAFFEHWLAQDADGDGIPEWRDQRQTHYMAFPTFGMGRDWAQGANITYVETPDLISYLMAEAIALIEMATVLKDKSSKNLFEGAYNMLAETLATLWHDDHYAYRDRDSHITSARKTLLSDGAGDAEHTLDQALVVPSRLVVKVEGGSRHTPKLTLHISGVNMAGEAVRERADSKAFYWYTGEGVYTSQTVFSEVRKVWCEGLSRVYRVHVNTLDTSRFDVNTLFPLLGVVPPEQADILADQALNNFMRPNGISMTHANDPHFDPSNADGAGGIWMYWQTLIGEGLIKAGKAGEVADMVKAQLNMLVQIYNAQHQTAQFYHSDEAQALSEKGHLNGIAPLALLQRLLGVSIPHAGKVVISQEFGWGRAVTIRQHGVYVRRTTKGIKVEFPSGYVVEQDASLKTDLVIEDPEPQAPVAYQPIALPAQAQTAIPDPLPPAPEIDSNQQRIIIEVDTD
ncbi:MAG: MGH1-like glycoside hydrolase domain-containing protein [Anaerolineae bacterium]